MKLKILPPFLAFLLLVGLLGLATGPGLVPDEVLVQYPQGYTKLLIGDLGRLSASGLIGSLIAAHHPLGGVAQVVQLLGLDPSKVEYIAYGTGPGLSPLAAIAGPTPEEVLPKLTGLQGAVGQPKSPYTAWEQKELAGLPLFLVEAQFGPLRIAWAYLVWGRGLWIGTEIAFGGEPDHARLQRTMELVGARMAGKIGCFSELPIALAVRGGDLAFIRITDPAVDRPLEPGEQAMGFAIKLTSEGATVHFALRTTSLQQAQQAEERINNGTSGYLSEGLYQGTLERLTRVGRELNFDVATTPAGAVGLLMTVMPQ